ncbi:carbamoyltransferase N-terminal domain-containing protein [Burkholderia lata]|nr:carbamoyltransferase N-terminal domain-containing protein [Burkholderia lata]
MGQGAARRTRCRLCVDDSKRFVERYHVTRSPERTETLTQRLDMLICGLKLTHDGAVALLDDDRLVFSVEIEKLDNSPRYSSIKSLDSVVRILGDFGYQVDDIDEWVIDGWDGMESGTATVSDGSHEQTLKLAPYHEGDGSLFRQAYSGEFTIAGKRKAFTSYLHVAGHLIGTYMTSSFAKRAEPAFGVVWDGGMFPRLYHVDPASNLIEAGGPVFPLIGHFYATAAHHFGPYKKSEQAGTASDLSVAGKLMAYIALGKADPAVVRLLAELYTVNFSANSEEVRQYLRTVGGWGTSVEPSMKHVHKFFLDVAKALDGLKVRDEDVLASVHEFLEELLVSQVTSRIVEWKGNGKWNLCFAGGCALNIKWNSALRAHPLFNDVWVPPFPNDSGSALGTAATHLMQTRKITALNWHPRLGPALVPTTSIPDGWQVTPCTPKALAAILHTEGKPVVMLNGRAELGPRALGGRSIIAAATDPAMKTLLNEVKDREHFRPVAPLCLTEEAPHIFDPGTPDPHMLFDHYVRENWVEKIPAVLHLDGTARLQTVSTDDDPVLEEILREYFSLSGVPVLCNTSANYNGRGFFPDVASAMQWGRIDLIWSDGSLYRKTAR